MTVYIIYAYSYNEPEDVVGVFNRKADAEDFLIKNGWRLEPNYESPAQFRFGKEPWTNGVKSATIQEHKVR